MGKEKPRALDEKTGFIRSGTEGTRTLDLRLDRKKAYILHSRNS